MAELVSTFEFPITCCRNAVTDFNMLAIGRRILDIHRMREEKGKSIGDGCLMLVAD